MAIYKPTVITEKGYEVIQNVINGEQTFDITKVTLGDGQPKDEDILNLTDLVSPKIQATITDVAKNDDGSTSVHCVFDNTNINESIFLNEIGVFVKDKDGKDVLYSYSTADGKGDYFGAGETVLQEKIDIRIYTSTIDTINATLEAQTHAKEIGTDILGYENKSLETLIIDIMAETEEVQESLNNVKFRKTTGVLEYSLDGGVNWLKVNGQRIDFTLPTSEFNPEWSEGAPAPLNILANSAVLYGNKVYVFGGNVSPYNYLQIYDITANSWSEGASAPKHMSGSSSILYGNKVYIFGGGSQPCNYLQIYDITANSWSEGLSAPKNTHKSSAVLYGNKVYVFGGDTSPYNYLQIYDITANSWTEGLSAPKNMKMSSSILYGSRIYTFGGNDVPNDYLQIYDITANSWSEGASAPKNINWNSSMFYQNKVYIFGGGSQPCNCLQIYDISSNSWGEGVSAPKNMQASKAILHNKKVYVFAGYTSPYKYLQIYDLIGYEYADDRGVKYKVGNFEKDDIIYSSAKLYDQNDTLYSAGVEHILTNDVEIFAYLQVPTTSQHVGWIQKNGAKGITAVTRNSRPKVNVDMNLFR